MKMADLNNFNEKLRIAGEKTKHIIPERMRRPMMIMLIGLVILFGGIVAYKVFVNVMMKRFFATMQNQTYTVSTAVAATEIWKPQVNAVGSTRATLGVNITAQLGGMIQKIEFTPGALVKANDVLVQQNADPNMGQLHALQANMELAKITYERDKRQYEIKGISKQQLDADLQNWKSLQGQVEQQQAIVNQLTIKAPFSGRLGISQVNPGQYLSPGNAVVTLQSLDPIYVDFYIPQNQLSYVAVGQEVDIKIDAFPNQTFKAKISTINPIIEKSTRNVEVEATLANPDNVVLPGMFASANINRDITQQLITLPKAAVTFNPYGDLVYLVQKNGTDKNGKQTFKVHQKFVTVGDSRGDQVSILTGVKEGDEVVTSGISECYQFNDSCTWHSRYLFDASHAISLH
jgi:membrane fusion protein (multidrug efflux system)